jgi:hypothetical protein
VDQQEREQCALFRSAQGHGFAGRDRFQRPEQAKFDRVP